MYWSWTPFLREDGLVLVADEDVTLAARERVSSDSRALLSWTETS